MRSVGTVVALLAVGMLFAGCSAQEVAESTPTASSNPPVASADTPGASDIEATQAVAVDALRAYLDREQGPDAWLDGLAPYLARDAVDAYATVDPARIPQATLNGDPLLAQGTATALSYLVPTTGGQWRVEMVKEGEAGSTRWAVSRFVPPEGVE